MIRFVRGDIVQAEADALVNTVNTVGVMGKGVALQFKRQFPENYAFYRKACKRGEVQPGKMLIFPTERIQPRYIINFPTKRHWREKSRMEDIQAGLSDLVEHIRHLEIRSVALPALGCGLGGLDWGEVKAVIQEALQPLANEVDILVYEPAEQEQTAPQRKPPLNPTLAALLCLARRYTEIEPELRAQDVHHLAYVLAEMGCWVGGRRKRDFYVDGMGLHSAVVERLLRERLSGKYLQKIKGYRGRLLFVVPDDVLQEASRVVERSARVRQSLNRAVALVKGFEGAFSLQLLALAMHVHPTLFRLDPSVAIDHILDVDPIKKTGYEPATLRQMAEEVWKHVCEVYSALNSASAAA